MSNILLEKILSSENELRDSALRSALVFNSRSGSVDYEDTLAQAVLGFILEQRKATSFDEIVRRFSSFQTSEQVSVRFRRAIDTLISRGFIFESGGNYCYSSKEDDAFLDDLKERTKRLVVKVRKNAESYLKKQLKSSIVEINIEKALSVYLNQFSFAYFGVKKPADSTQTKDAIQVCTQGLDDQSEADALVLSLSETIQNPSQEDRDVLETWAKAYFAAAMTGLDPMLNHLHSDKMRGKSFVLDTDIVLHCLVNNTRQSQLYLSMVKRLQKMGCRIIIPADVLLEVRCHAEAAKKRFKAFGSVLVSYSDDMLDAEVNNVFIEDFVHKVQNDLDCDRNYASFAQIVNNVCDPSYPEILTEVIEDRIGKGVVILGDIEIEPQHSSVYNSLSEIILRITKMSEKAQYRTDEDNERISKTDARLYYYVYHKNEQTDSKEFLSSKVYLLTNTTKSLKAAKEIQFEKDNIICNPSVLIGVLMRIGEVPEKEAVLNLFENPFLAYTGAMIWEKIEPLVKAGAQFKEASIRWMHKNYADNLDRILTEETFEGRICALKELNQRGLIGLFTEKQLIDTFEENRRLKEELEQQQKVIEKYKTKERLYAKPMLRGKGGSPNNRSGKRSKKR